MCACVCVSRVDSVCVTYSILCLFRVRACVHAFACVLLLACQPTHVPHLCVCVCVCVCVSTYRLEVGPLADFCNAFLAEVLRVSSFIQLLKQASHFHMEDMVKRILEFSETW